MISVNTQYLPASFVDPSTGNLKVPEQEAQAFADGIQARVEHMPPAEKEIFLALLQGSDIAPTASGNVPGDTEASIDNLEGAAERLSRIMTSSTIDLLARVMVENAAQSRKDALQDRLSAHETAKSQLQSQANSMRDAADSLMTGAIVSLVVSVVTAAISIAAAGISIRGGAKAFEDAGAANAPGVSKTTSDSLLAQSAASNSKAGGVGAIGGSVNSLGGAVSGASNSLGQAEAKEADAEGADAAATAEYEKSQADTKKEIEQSLDELIKSIINFLKELRDAQANQMQALTKI
ncbi:hypothetical protein [Prosthecomicrobium sp. N25]|uniref:hypothetical protein n=1 Tax=Prosthecomicrobium sp. N25 TaxID=3129254 RepID=UPI00307688C3